MEDESMISEFNEAQLQIMRLNNIWLGCRNYRNNGKLIDWKWALVDAEIELNNDAMRIDKQKNTNWIQEIKDLNEEIEKEEDKDDLAKLFNKLVEKEKKLRKLQEDAGKGTKLKPERDKF